MSNPPLAWVERLLEDVARDEAGSALTSDVEMRCLRRKSSVERVGALSLESNGDGRASSADDALVDCGCSAVEARLAVGIVTEDSGAVSSWAEALRDSSIERVVAESLTTRLLLVTPRGDDCELLRAPDTAGLPSRAVAFSVLETLL